MRELLFRLAFEAIVCDRPEGAAALVDVARDQPPELQRAWLEMLDRMLGGEEPSAAPLP